MKLHEEKYQTATNILTSSLGKKGVWADPTRYAEQCWTRDFALATQPALFSKGLIEIAQVHLGNLSNLQRQNGQIPILFLDDERKWLSEKERKSAEQGRPSFMLSRYNEGELWNLTPGTKDSEIMYVLAMLDHANYDPEFVDQYQENISEAIEYVEQNLVRDGLITGCDWRDTMHIELGDKTLLTNNSIWYKVVSAFQSKEVASELREKIRSTFISNGNLIDYPGSNRFDPLGASLAVLYGAIDPQDYELVLKGFDDVDSDHGYTIKCRHNPTNSKEAEVIEKTDGVVVWPFVVGFSILALLKMGESEKAMEQFRKLTELDGFYEWYDPQDGKGYGASLQLWSAVLYIRAYDEIW